MADLERIFFEGEEIVEVDRNSRDILSDPMLNKGTAFTTEERIDLGIDSLLPFHCSTIERQVERRYINFCDRKTPIDKYLFLTALQDRNETLFFRLVEEHAEEMLPYIYTPTVGDVALDYSYLYNQNRGVYLSYPLKDRMDELVANIPKERVDVIVVTDGERILGLGDLGVGGMVIPAKKLVFYSLFGGFHPAYTLPVFLDVGTNNPKLLEDPLYLGWRHERIKAQEYDDFVDSFLQAVNKRYPGVLIQWEDFAKQNAYPLLDRYKDKYCSFNDDIQGTAGVAMAGIFAAIRATKTNLRSQRILIYGGGSAGIGVADLIAKAMLEQDISEEEAKSCIYVLGRNGLVHTQSQGIDEMKRRFMQDAKKIKAWGVSDLQNVTLMETVKCAKPTILIGTSAQPGAFTQEITTEMLKHVDLPIIFPLSNPTSKSEAVPRDIIEWTKGKALVATGSPFSPVEYEGRKISIGQCNNVFIFPGIARGVFATGAKRVTDLMFLRAAEVLSKFAPIIENPDDSLFPSIQKLSLISQEIAVAVGLEAVNQGLSTLSPEDVEKAVKKSAWKPKYPKIRRKR